ncbi:MAG TPA: cytochrome c3 family protein [Anaerolineales bacterium]|nr:cytochrome c3 family protein [Anaerolineales bacterium]
MIRMKFHRNRKSWLVFMVVFTISMIAGAAVSLTHPVQAAPGVAPAEQTESGSYAGSSACANCHANLHETWLNTRHKEAFSSPIFQRDWTAMGSQVSCLECHTTGYDRITGQYAEEGVTCEACHGPFQTGHPMTQMPITPNAELCSRCHKQTTDEWRASVHSENSVQCEACHNPHTQTPMAASITELCVNCHKDRGDSFTHGTHANAGLECSNCHMYSSPRSTSPIEGLVPTGHTFSVGSEACIGCHQDTVHTRDEIVKLTGEIQNIAVVDTATLEQKIDEQEQLISSLESRSTVRLYTGLAQGAIIGLVTGGVAAWVVSRGIRVVEVEEDDEKN